MIKSQRRAGPGRLLRDHERLAVVTLLASWPVAADRFTPRVLAALRRAGLVCDREGSGVRPMVDRCRAALRTGRIS